jgi:hypothetical protein
MDVRVLLGERGSFEEGNNRRYMYALYIDRDGEGRANMLVGANKL